MQPASDRDRPYGQFAGFLLYGSLISLIHPLIILLLAVSACITDHAFKIPQI
jgi:hypothetical protein